MLDMYSMSEDMRELIQKCWHEEPNERPNFSAAKKILERMNRYSIITLIYFHCTYRKYIFTVIDPLNFHL